MRAVDMTRRAIEHYKAQLLWFRDHVAEEEAHFFDNDIALCDCILQGLDAEKGIPRAPRQAAAGV